MTDEPPDTDLETNDHDEFDSESFGRRPGGIDPGDLDRLFSVLEATVGSDSLGVEATDRLLTILEATLVTPTRLDPEETDRLFSVLESSVLNPADPDRATDVLTVLSAAITEPRGFDATESEGLLSVLEAALVDPSDPTPGAEDVFSILDSVGADDGENGERSGLSSLLDSAGLDLSRADDANENVFSVLGVEGVTTGDDTGSVNGELDDQFRIARIVAAVTQRSTDYSLRSGVRIGTAMVRAATTTESPADLLDELRTIAYDELNQLGADVDDRAPDTDRSDDWPDGSRIETRDVLQERGARLLAMSADVDHEEAVHPAYPGILDDLAADEARILRLLATEGPQPSVDVRDVGYVPITSELIAAGLSMIGSEAGLWYEDRTTAYMNNLKRLGLIWFSDEPVAEIKRYQVLEAQPIVSDAIDECRRAKTIRRSVHLTPFGVDFCHVCLPFEVEADRPSSVYEPPDSPRE